jgi:hypothetical protein
MRWDSDWVNVSICCAGEYVGLEEIDNGIWNVCFGPVKLGRLIGQKDENCVSAAPVHVVVRRRRPRHLLFLPTRAAFHLKLFSVGEGFQPR